MMHTMKGWGIDTGKYICEILMCIAYGNHVVCCSGQHYCIARVFFPSSYLLLFSCQYIIIAVVLDSISQDLVFLFFVDV